jgi:hypothetical protein
MKCPWFQKRKKGILKQVDSHLVCYEISLGEREKIMKNFDYFDKDQMT